ncbi:prolyl oligopeptidase family serine peptidase [Roseiconus nitratireducens]|uniref:Prolyl oligopeptidase family serine peptidase n=1 Tax=Roseiconus nitratireducens TaxID=2605748 RepID=A0A5M6D2A1_9BACT|nr:prolyl oligopeptidase family serine peptidase [Roseiconus nitratireducens]KAA5540740.1 prolyl oligopeptidase family serine peptidase [Roseiconus nitratireducens]
MTRFLFVLICLCFVGVCRGDGPADNDATSVRPIPPPGIELPKQQAEHLRQRCLSVREAWSTQVQQVHDRAGRGNRFEKAENERRLAALTDLAAEILVFPRAVELALEFDQFHHERDIASADLLLDLAEERITKASQQANWRHVVGLDAGDQQQLGDQRQLIVGGYRSKIDDSFQPYALVVPAGFGASDVRPRRLDLWFHGRGETLSEVNFLQGGRNSAGQYTPEDTFVLHPYGRYSNAFKFAGEIDVLEALDHVASHLPVDASRISARGFSMGGAACWQFATHYADRFFAANPGAGFSETPEFLKSFQGEDLSQTPAYQRTLWQWYDCPPWARNLIQCPTVAYSGEIDRQKQAADVMEATLADEGIDLMHIIGPQTAHKIHPDSKVEIERRMNQLAQTADARFPTTVDFTTTMLRYHKMHWVDVRGLQQHWKPATVRATLSSDAAGSRIAVQTNNVTHLTLNFPAGQWSGAFPGRPEITIDGDTISGGAVGSDRSWKVRLQLDSGHWAVADSKDTSLRKRPGLQGPIDDAFMDSFLFVTPTGTSSDRAFETWCQSELKHAQTHWRKHFRGDVRQVRDVDLSPQQIAENHLILFGDAESNTVLASIADRLPVRWSDDAIRLGDQQVPKAGHAVVLIYPNPLNPDRYIVLNSGFTFREYDYLNNARQTPKLPDWAILDITRGATARDAGQVRSAGFFDESWKP